MTISKQYRAALFAGAALSLMATFASAAPWRIVDITGQVRVSIPGGTPSAGRLNEMLPTGTSVTTAAGGRATLDNGEQRIVVAPNSRLTVQPDAGGFTRIAQDLGAAMFKVDKKAAPHFRVDTPLLAAIVKGTTFTVMVEGASDAVSVAEGLVEVRSNLNAVGSDVAAGATGTVMRDAPSAVQVVTPASAPAGPAMAPVNIAPIDYKAASDGLIDVAPAVGQAVQDAAVVRAIAAPSNNAVGASVQDSPAVATGGSIGAAVSQIASVEAGQRETATQVATVAGLANGNNGLALGVSGNGNGNGNNGNGNGNGGSNAAAAVATADPAATSAPSNNGNGAAGVASNGNNGNGNGNGNSGNSGNGNGNGGSVAVADASGAVTGGNSGNGNGNSGNGNANGAANGNSGNGNGNGNGGVVAPIVTTVAGLAGAATGNNGNGNGNGNGNSGNGNANGAANGNSGNGNGNGGGIIETVVAPVVTTVVDTTGGIVGAVTGNGNSGNGNANGNSGNGNGNSGNGNSGNGNGNNGNGNGNGGSNVVTPIVAAVTAPVTGLLGPLSGNGNSGNGNSGNGNSGNGNSGNSGNGNGNSGG